LNIAPYPTYQPSGVEWLGNIPKDWSVKRLKWSVDGCFNGVWGDEPDGIDDVVCLRVADFNRDNYTISTEALTLRAIEAKQLESRKLKRGDLLIEKSGGGEKQLVGCVVYFDHEFDAVCSNFVARMPVAEGHLPRYWAYVHAGLYAGKLNYPAIKQTTGIQNLDAALYLDTLAAYPPLAEQQQIAAFLDWKTSQIDALIAKKQALLQKLKEKRLAVITQAVTKGLNPDAPMRDSGIAWLGKVPAHWGVKRLKFVAHVGNGSTPNREDSAYWDGGTYPWLNSSVVNQEQVTNADQFVTPLALSECHLPRISPPAVLVGITGQGKTRGMATTLLFEATINQHLAYVKPDEAKASVGFLRRVFDMAYAHLRIESENGGSTKGAITCEQIAELPIPVPPLDEQVVISERIDMALAKLARMSDNAKSAITRLTEYRSALITAATTGKIDVRSWQAPQETV
jgi:type I restriction enzyme S subunit